MDFFTAPTIAFGVLFCFFVIVHDRRRILHFNVTKHPTSVWVTQQMREAFHYDSAPKYLIFDRGAYFDGEVVAVIKSFGIDHKRTGLQSPRQNGIAERRVGSCHRELLDQIIVVNECHLQRFLNESILYYRNDTTHLGLSKQTPAGRMVAEQADGGSMIISKPRIGGLHHRYELAA